MNSKTGVNVRQLFNGDAPDFGDLLITSIEYDSRKVGRGSCFVALKGLVTDGHIFLNDAVKRGASLLVVDNSVQVDQSVEKGANVMRVDDTRKELARLADRFYGHPSVPLDVIGVTGTNGKTTVCYFLQSLLNEAGYKTSRFGTVGYDFPDKTKEADKTTPESVDLQKMFKHASDWPNPRCVMEVSSHGLALGRLERTRFKGGVFTNITQDHLDFHSTMEEYTAAKKRFFTDYDFDYAVINSDDPVSAQWLKESIFNCRVITYGESEGADVRLLKSVSDISGSKMSLSTPAGDMEIETNLPGGYNVYNVMATAAVGIAESIGGEVIKKSVASLKNVPGRFEKIDEGQDFFVIVDYAHTDNALANALKAARSLARGKVICMFGCGGDRDREKRKLMGAVADELADVLVVTSDNPRSEDPQAIIEDILKGVARPLGEKLHVVPLRREAISLAIKTASKGDLVLLAGKGHEDYQVIGTTMHHFDDREVASEVLREIK
ncbi:MAG: UDP-N-acetylmuramoyl-L-alanyl-D-glutamate--2,6-diaminopimelate ligase [Nitrospinota bacterium]